VKAIQGSDVSSAPEYFPVSLASDENQHELRRKIQRLDSLLHELGVDSVILGCSELPAAFKLLSAVEYTLVNPADLVREAVVKGLKE
jgi:aspartate/glutamate racemase